MRRVVVGYSGGVTSAWCLAWALREYPHHEVVALFHDTKSEDADTYRYLREMATLLGTDITERSDGRSVEQVEDDENALANNRMAFCSRILKILPRNRYFTELRESGVTEIVLVLAFTSKEPERMQRAAANSWAGGYTVRFPLAEQAITKQMCADWSHALGVRVPSMYVLALEDQVAGAHAAYEDALRRLRDQADEIGARKIAEEDLGCRLIEREAQLAEATERAAAAEGALHEISRERKFYVHENAELTAGVERLLTRREQLESEVGQYRALVGSLEKARQWCACVSIATEELGRVEECWAGAERLRLVLEAATIPGAW